MLNVASQYEKLGWSEQVQRWEDMTILVKRHSGEAPPDEWLVVETTLPKNGYK